MKFDVCVVGAGLTGLTAARYLADKGKRVLIFEQTNRIGGLCKEGHFKK
jgi:phytoene dehydrogenase-like protein